MGCETESYASRFVAEDYAHGDIQTDSAEAELQSSIRQLQARICTLCQRRLVFQDLILED